MKKFLLILATLAASCGMYADEWTRPIYSGNFQPLTVGDTVHIYNTESQRFLGEGNDWGTHATIAEGAGLLCTVQQYVADEALEWDGKSYVIRIRSLEKDGWHDLFITDGGNVYVDRSNQEDYIWSFNDLGDNTYQIFGSDANPTWKSSGDFAGYLLGHFTGYINTRDNIETGTGVIYDLAGEDSSYGPGEFLTKWSFVSEKDFSEYIPKVATWQIAMDLKRSIEKAEAEGITGLEHPKAVFANTSSSIDDLFAAIDEIGKITLAYYEQTVTPSNPKVVYTDPCDNIDGWTNGINASTWGTQTWIDGSWEGFEGNTLDIWGTSMCGSVGKVSNGMPNGVYEISMAVYSKNLDGVVFANENSVAVGANAAGKTYKVTTNVTDGQLSFGFNQSEEGENWVAIDNLKVSYFGKGVEAYKYWINSLKESAPDFDNEIVQQALVDEYKQVLETVNVATTDEEILAAIPAYEEILNKLNLNIAAYAALAEEISNAENLIANEYMNSHYGEMLGDATTEYGDIVQDHKLGTADVEDKIADFKSSINEAQEYVWAVEKLENEMATAEQTYIEYNATCSLEASMAYDAFCEKMEKLDKSNLITADINALLNELYNVEFNLTVSTDPASDDNPINYTAKIFNPNFDAFGEGWTNEGWNTFGSNDWNFGDGVVFDKNYLNLWTASSVATASQTLTNLPAGTYIFQLSAYTESDGVVVFANDNTTPVINGQNENGVPTSVGNLEGVETVWRGNAYEVPVAVGEDGTLVIGLRSTSGTEDWSVIDNARLTYYGTNSSIDTGISAITSSKTNNSSVYSISGVKVADSLSGLKKGVYIHSGKKYMIK